LGTNVKKFEPRLTRQSADSGITALATKVDENLLLLKRFLSDLTVNVNQVLTTFDIAVGGGAPTGGGTTFDFGSDGLQDGTGVEAWKDERVCDFTAAATPNLALVVLGLGMSSAGTGTLRVRIGGTSHAADGTVVAVAFLIGGAFTQFVVRQTALNPGTPALLKLTVQASVAGQKAQVKGVSISVR
jgi:hypothetical protein